MPCQQHAQLAFPHNVYKIHVLPLVKKYLFIEKKLENKMCLEFDLISNFLLKNKANRDMLKVKPKKMDVTLVNVCINSNYLEGGRIRPPPCDGCG